ncbi:hypothetical protein [Aestuariivirga sp.]|uniref:hypothetical protein n=1 Tax=Aestuariivirga sp. TaxID=2650926 RepID=UPI00301616B0
MANDTDHRLVTDLMGLVQQRETDPASAERIRAVPSTLRRIIDIVLWSSITNLILLGVFLAGWNSDGIRSYVLQRLGPTYANVTRSDDPPANARPELHDNELLTNGPQRQLKGPLQITLVPSSAAPEVAVDTTTVPPPQSEPVDVAATSDGAQEPDQGDGSGDITVGPEDPAAQLTRSPVLHKGQKSGDVEIGSFNTVSLPGSSAECLDTAYGLLDDAGASRDKLKVLAESKMITVARICADNGSLVVTCRLDQITISPRRLKPNETCTG